jgi:pimeloyl-ACP methyl ester carboxylesterase
MPSREVHSGDRVLTVYVDGPDDGPVILHHHGTPLAGGPLRRWVDDAAARGARLVCYDRPGYGGSSPDPGRNVGAAAADCAAIMDALGVARFATWGISGGGPHALACAALLGDRVFAAASLAGVTPFDAHGLNYCRGMGQDNIVEFGLAIAGREYIEPFSERKAAEMRTATAAEITESISTLVSPADHAVLDGEIGNYWVDSLRVTFAQGAGGWVDDDLAFVEPFGFDLGAISVPTLIVHGEQDRFVPTDHGRWLASAIPGAEQWISPEEGHLTLMINRVPNVHDWLLARA